MSITKELLRYSFPQKERIFDINYQYAVGLEITDIWTYQNSLYLEVTLSNLQKSTLKFSLYQNGIFQLQYYQKQLSDQNFNLHLNKIPFAKINFVENDRNIIIKNKIMKN